MAAWRETDENVIRQKLKNSMELDAIRSWIIWMASVSLIVFAVAALLQSFRRGSWEWLIWLCIWLAVNLPVAVMGLIRILRILRKPAGCFFCSVKLVKFQPKYWLQLWGDTYFSVVVEAPDGRKFYADTGAIFWSRALIGLRLCDFVNKTVTAAYNEETDQLILIG